jgi:hypothetical protein
LDSLPGETAPARDNSEATTGGPSLDKRRHAERMPSLAGGARGQVLTGSAGCATPVPTHPQTT